MKKIIVMTLALVLLAFASAYAEKGFGTPVACTIGADATFDPIGVTDSPYQYLRITARGGVTFYLSDIAAGTTYSTVADGESLIVGFDKPIVGPYTFCYGQSSSGDLVIEILPFNK